jgi:hypothetical protein
VFSTPSNLSKSYKLERSIMATETQTVQAQLNDISAHSEAQYPRKPLQLRGLLDQYESFDVTPVIGREFKDVNLKEWLRAPNSDDLLRDLAITSTGYPHLLKKPTNTFHSISAWCCLLLRPERPRQRAAKGACPASRRTLRKTSDVEAAYTPCQQLRTTSGRQRRRNKRHQL